MKKAIAKNIITFILTFVICTGTLLAVCLIPQSAIQNNSAESSEYFSEHGGFPVLIEGHANSRIDNYADCVLFNVIYNIDEEHPIKSVIAAPYYRIEGNDAYKDYASSVIEGKEPNNEYSRYWHGSQVFIRPMLTFASVEQIRWILFGGLAALNAALGILLLRRKAYAPAGVYFVSLLLVQFWMCAFSIEYIMSFLVMTAVCIAIILMWDKGELKEDAYCESKMTRIFIVSGAATCFLDFLTAETLTFTVPFIMYMMLYRSGTKKDEKKHKDFRLHFVRLFKWGIAWLMSYAAMFAVKWALVYGVMGKTAFLNVLDNAANRIDGQVALDNATGLGGEVLTAGQTILTGILRNIACILPASEYLSATGVIGVSLGILAVLAAVFYLFRGERIDGSFIGILLLVAMIPYLRYACLFSHSFIHYFFTYRAQMAAVMAVLAVMVYNLKPSYVMPASKRRKKK